MVAILEEVLWFIVCSTLIIFLCSFLPESCFTNKFVVVVVQMKLNLHFLRINTDQEE